MNKTKKVILSFICFVSLLFCITGNVSALEKLGSINIELEDGWTGTSKENVEFRVIQIGNMIDGEYFLIKEFQNLDIDLNKIDTAEKLQEAADMIIKELNNYDFESIIKKTDQTGHVSFNELETGIYLVENTDRNNYDNIAPTLIFIPTYMEKGDYVNSMNYDVKVIPKHSPVIKVEISKQDITTSQELEGAKLSVTDKETHKVIEEWISGKTPHLMKDLDVGRTYVLTELLAPKNYQLAQSIEFTIEDTGDVQKVTMYDELIPQIKTGDDNGVLLYGGLAIGSLGLIVSIIVRTYRKKQDN